MAYIVEEVRDFSKGTVTTVEDHAISRGAASRTRNMINLGDSFELVPGAQILGTPLAASGRVAGLGIAQDVEGNDRLARVRDTNLEIWNPDTEAWDVAKNNLTDDVDTGIFGYRTPAGAFMLITSVSDGPLRINLVNPTSVKDLYAAGTNYRGIFPVYSNRGYVVGREGYETTIYASHIDDDFPYTAVNNENIGTGDGVTTTFTDTLANTLVAARTVVVTAGAVTGTDDGEGNITGSGIASGTINYTTGAISVTFSVAPAGAAAVECDYSYETPNSDGITDFTYSGTRLAGEGDLIFQFDGSDPAKFIAEFRGTKYVFHERSIWTIEFNDDDTSVVNKVYRTNTGAASWRSVLPTNDGLAYADQSNPDKPVLRFLRYSELAGTEVPEEISVNVDLTGYNFDDGCSVEWEDFYIWCCKSPGAEANDTMLYYNTRWKTIDFGDGNWRCFARGKDALYAGSSLSGDVYQLFVGYDMDDIDIIGEWESRDDDLDIVELKKCKKFVIEGDMFRAQAGRVEASYDEEDWVTIDTVTEDDFLQGSGSTAYGALLYGSSSGSSGIPTYRFLKEMRFGQSKFMRVKIRFVFYGSGYGRVKMYTFKDIRKKGFKLPTKFR
jgi:hypothetical protein